MGSAAAGPGRFIAGFFESMGENRLGVCCGPAVGEHLLQTQVIRIEAEQKLADVTPRLNPMALGAGKIVYNTAARGPAASLPRKSQFFRPMAWRRSVLSLTLLSIVRRPSSV